MGATTPEKLGPWCCEMKLQMLYKSDLKCDFTTNSHKITKQSYNWSGTITLTCLQCKCCAITTAKTKNSTNLKVKVERKNNKWKRYRMEQKFLISALATCRVVTKISSCRVNTTSRRGIKRLGISFGSIFFYFPIKVAGGHSLSSWGKSPAPGS